MKQIANMIPEWVFNLSILVIVPSATVYLIKNWSKYVR
jgi:hypothetical protein